MTGTHIPPPSQIPRVQVLYHDLLDLDQITLHSTLFFQNNPMDRNIAPDTLMSHKGDDRSMTIYFLSKHIFQGNTIAAEALLIALLS